MSRTLPRDEAVEADAAAEDGDEAEDDDEEEDEEVGDVVERLERPVARLCRAAVVGEGIVDEEDAPSEEDH